MPVRRRPHPDLLGSATSLDVATVRRVIRRIRGNNKQEGCARNGKTLVCGGKRETVKGEARTLRFPGGRMLLRLLQLAPAAQDGRRALTEACP